MLNLKIRSWWRNVSGKLNEIIGGLVGFVLGLWSVDVLPRWGAHLFVELRPNVLSKYFLPSNRQKVAVTRIWEHITLSGLAISCSRWLFPSTDHNPRMYLWQGPLPKNWIIFYRDSHSKCAVSRPALNLNQFAPFCQEAAILQVLLWYTLNTHIYVRISYLYLLYNVSIYISSISATALSLSLSLSYLSLSFTLANKKFGQKFSACLSLASQAQIQQALKPTVDYRATSSVWKYSEGYICEHFSHFPLPISAWKVDLMHKLCRHKKTFRFFCRRISNEEYSLVPERNTFRTVSEHNLI